MEVIPVTRHVHYIWWFIFFFITNGKYREKNNITLLHYIYKYQETPIFTFEIYAVHNPYIIVHYTI